jgi:hypothetical protein
MGEMDRRGFIKLAGLGPAVRRRDIADREPA